mmetsp:Transcript_10527/g.33653  ORF Transcript_10527/g.33653 Transcript_10527/m.33653 type:complete len:444 (-) Transcript_10527:102-1433(-)
MGSGSRSVRRLVMVSAAMVWPQHRGYMVARSWVPTRRGVIVGAGRDFVGLPKAVHRVSGVAYPLRELNESSPEAFSGLPDLSRPFTVLGIETSCDDTAVGVVRSDGIVLADAARSQYEVHAQYGGVVPGLAKAAHEAAIDDVVDRALEEAGLSLSDVDAVAATVGPGLEICLRVGARKGVQLATEADKPFVGCHHLEAHCLVTRLADHCPFPFAALVVSGGHTMILKCEGVGRYDVLGGTLDDALGEAYDKAARMLGLAAAGGPALERLALDGDPKAFALPVPMRKRKDCDFSYAGLKNALRVQINNKLAELGTDALPRDVLADLAASFQHVAVTHLEDRLKRAFDRLDHDPAFAHLSAKPVLALVGGVASNQHVRRRLAALCDAAGWALAIPPPRLCTDNGVMIAWAAVERLRLGFSDPLQDDVYPRFPFRAPPDPALRASS